MDGPSPYDVVAYPSGVIPQTHPDRLATMAALFGLRAAQVEHCRVLELGCGDGRNLIAMAAVLPSSTFLGIDVAAAPIRQGQRALAQLGLQNLTLRQLDLLEFPKNEGGFDFIIAHGLYSWIPGSVRDQLLAICGRHLSPAGVAYVSYNAYPGHHARDLARRIMRYHVAAFPDPEEQVRQGRALLKFLAGAKPTPDLYHRMLDQELQRCLKYPDASLYHDDLASTNHPVYFHEFAAHAGQHGLQYLAEADFRDMQADGFSEEVLAVLRQIQAEDVVAQEQYLDFLKGRAFRQTLLCRSEVRLDRPPRPERIADLQIASPARPSSPHSDLRTPAMEDFTGPEGIVIATANSAVKMALVQLGQVWPASIPFHRLPGLSQNSEPTSAAEPLAEFFLRAYGLGFVELHAVAPPLVSKVSERPRASPLARFQLQSSHTVSTLRHVDLQLQDSLGRHLVQLLDGTRDRAAVLRDLTGLVRNGAAVVQREGQPVNDLDRAVEIVEAELDQNLAVLARLGLLAS